MGRLQSQLRSSANFAEVKWEIPNKTKMLLRYGRLSLLVDTPQIKSVNRSGYVSGDSTITQLKRSSVIRACR
jgi:hypothetical protein